MARAGMSMQALIRRRRRAGFVGRRGELDAFRNNFDLPPDDDRHRFLFHVHGAAGVGKTFLVREMEQVARERGALTAYLDESVGSVPEVLDALAGQFARQGHPSKELQKRLAEYRQKRHEAEAVFLRDPAAAGPAADGGAAPGRPSALGTAAARASLTGLGMVPVVGAFAGALDAAELAQGADRLRAALGARFHDQDHVRLVLEPEQALTPVLVDALAGAEAPWIVLFLDTYERTGAFLDGWLSDLMTTERYGALPAHVVVVLSGQRPFDAMRWGGWAEFVADLPLAPFDDAEARELLAIKGTTDEAVVAEVLRLSGGLPVFVSMLAEGRPGAADDVEDPSVTAVERFLRWESDPVRRAAALACALPRGLDEDVFRAAVDDAAAGQYAWLCSLPFVGEHGRRVRYHDVVRGPMLRLMRHQSPRDVAARHTRLADTFAAWCEEAADGVDARELWRHEPWRAHRLEETYHRLCARPTAALPEALAQAATACWHGDAALARRWARMLHDAGEDAGDADLRRWGRDLAAALGEPGGGPGSAPDGAADGVAGALGTGGELAALSVLLSRPGLDPRGHALAQAARGYRLSRHAEADDPDDPDDTDDPGYTGVIEQALAAYDLALELDPTLARAYYERAMLRMREQLGPAALADLDAADRLLPDTSWILAQRGELLRAAGRTADAAADLDRAIALDPSRPFGYASRGVCRAVLGDREGALADLNQALVLDGDYLWALVRRARLWRREGAWQTAFADLDHAVRVAPDSAWIASERGDAYRLAKRYEEAEAELSRCLDLAPRYASALAGRGTVRTLQGRYDEAMADLDRALELDPGYTWARSQRARTRFLRMLRAGSGGDFSVGWNRAFALSPPRERAQLRADLDGVLADDPGHDQALMMRGMTHIVDRAFGEALRDLRLSSEAELAGDTPLRLGIGVCLVIGRTAEALALVERLAAGGAAGWQALAGEVLLLCDRAEQAAPLLAAAPTDTSTDLLRARALRRTARFAAARLAAARAGTDDAFRGAYQLALTVSRADGLPAAAGWWRVAEPPPTDVGDFEWTRVSAVRGYAQGHWTAADRCLDALLTGEQDWDDLGELVADLADLARCPGADPPRLGPRLTRAAAVRDAVRARYAQPPPE